MTEEKKTDEAMKAMDKAASAILGLFALGEERAQKLFDELVQKGQQAKEQESSRLARILAQAQKERDELVRKSREEFSNALSRLNLATKDDIARLERLINEKLK